MTTLATSPAGCWERKAMKGKWNLLMCGKHPGKLRIWFNFLVSMWWKHNLCNFFGLIMITQLLKEELIDWSMHTIYLCFQFPLSLQTPNPAFTFNGLAYRFPQVALDQPLSQMHLMIIGCATLWTPVSEVKENHCKNMSRHLQRSGNMILL